jgi:3'-phosphoadenosine 5'-phosphosulfate (PAPS) 3'-phosphatase
MTQHFPGLKIIGEEDMSKTVEYDNKYLNNIETVVDILSDADIPEEFRELRTDNLCIYLDPIDSTEQFIKRNYEPVTSLVGIALKGDAFIGMVHFPFYKGKRTDSLVFFNIPTKGIFVFNTETNETKKVDVKFTEDMVFVSSSSSRNKLVTECKFYY